MEITIGRVVLYTLHEQDAEQINRRRTNGKDIARRIQKNDPNEMSSSWPIGAQAHIGNEVKAGEQFPMLVTKVWSPGYVNGQVFLDGNVSISRSAGFVSPAEGSPTQVLTRL